jgi:lysozyme
MKYDKQALRNQLKADEGVRESAYPDSLGYITIGVGRLIDKRKGGRLRPAEIDYLLDNDIDELDAQLGKRLPWLNTLSPARQQVLMNMAFNLGIDGLLGFKNTLGMIAAGDYASAADAMLKSKWAGQVGDRAKRLADMMRKG